MLYLETSSTSDTQNVLYIVYTDCHLPNDIHALHRMSCTLLYMCYNWNVRYISYTECHAWSCILV